MPTYDYKCDACGHAFEKFQSIKADPIRKCPSCGKNKVNRLIGTGAGLIFKGSGFYITDYRSESYKSAAKNDAPGTTGAGAKEGSGTSAGSSSESKPAAGAAAPAGAASKPAASPGPTAPAAKSKKPAS